MKGLINANRGPNAHWNSTVNTITQTVMRSYMELNRDLFEKLSQSNQNSNFTESEKDKSAQIASKWEALEKKFKH